MTFLYSGCSKQPEVSQKVVIDKSLPTPKINGHLSTMDTIAFEWQSISDSRVKGFYVYRSDPKDKSEKLKRVADVSSRYATHYVDEHLKPNTAYAYRFSSYKKDGIESLGSKTYRASTLPLIASVSFFRSIGNMPRSAKLIWRPHTDTQVKAYIIERKLKRDNKWEEIATIEGRLNPEYIDYDLADNEVYQYRLFALTYSGIKSVPSEIVTVVTKPLPNVIQNIETTKTLPRKILISWNPSQRENLSHYNIYRSDSENGSYDYYVKLSETSFKDKIDEDGASYFYKVTAVDSDGLESPKPKKPAHGMTLAKPKTPLDIRARVDKNSIIISWRHADNDTLKYTLIKTKKEGWLSKKVQEIKNITQESFTDSDVVADVTYSYQVVALNQYGIGSEPSEAVEIFIEAK
jgi:fibronectin type 3 domain-containing protein